MKYLRQLRCKCYSAHKLPEVAPPKIEKRDFACLISNFRNVSLHTNPLQSFIVKYNKNETYGNLLLNKKFKRKACRSYDGEVIQFLKLPPQNSCVTSKTKDPLYNTCPIYMYKTMQVWLSCLAVFMTFES